MGVRQLYLQTLAERGYVTDPAQMHAVDALERCAGNQTKAARMLGMSRRSFLTRLEAYSLPRPRKGAT